MLKQFLGLLIVGLFMVSTPSIADPVQNKLTQTANLTLHAHNEVMKLYSKLYFELEPLRCRPKGVTTAQYRNLIRDLFKRHRRSSLQYLSANEYRKWMTVAGRKLPYLEVYTFIAIRSMGCGSSSDVRLNKIYHQRDS